MIGRVVSLEPTPLEVFMEKSHFEESSWAHDNDMGKCTLTAAYLKDNERFAAVGITESCFFIVPMTFDPPYNPVWFGPMTRCVRA